MAGRSKGARDKVLADFADNVVRMAKINLGKTFTATNSRGKSYKKRIDNTGRLRSSIDYKLVTRDEDGRFSKASLDFTMLDYGLEVDSGRKAGTGISEEGQQSIIKWIKSKPLRIRDINNADPSKRGRFKTFKDAEQKATAIKGIAYAISRNIKENGIAATNFFTNPYKDKEIETWNSLQLYVADETVDYISLQIDLLNANSTKKS